jgi:hypothetical protein
MKSTLSQARIPSQSKLVGKEYEIGQSRAPKAKNASFPPHRKSFGQKFKGLFAMRQSMKPKNAEMEDSMGLKELSPTDGLFD